MNGNQAERQVQEIDLYELFLTFLEHARFIIIWFVAGALVAGACSYFLITPTYQATAKMYIVSASNNSIVDLTDLDIGSSLTNDYEVLILSDPVMERVANELGTEYEPEELLEMITIENPEDTRVINITATTTEPQFSRDLANTVMDVSIEYLPDTMSTTAPNIAQQAKAPDQKAAPSNSRNTLIGAILGLLIACVWLTIRFMRDDTIKTSEELEAYFGVTPLTSIPESSELDDEEGKTPKRKKPRRKRDNK